MAEIYADLVREYSEGHRAYHTLEHIRDCFHQFDSASQLAVRPDEVEAGLWFHDSIYDTHRSDNERRSAAWAQSALHEGGVSESTAARVAELVLATRHEAPVSGADACLLLDIDLSILGRGSSEFDAYEVGIRKEYSWVPDQAFRSARSRILESFLARASIYHTPLFRERYEAQARANITRSLANLRGSE